MRIQFIGGPKHKDYLEEEHTNRVLPFIDVTLPDKTQARYVLKSWLTEGGNPGARELDLERVYGWVELSEEEFHRLAAEEARTRAPKN
jgi:hypothetical protein